MIKHISSIFIAAIFISSSCQKLEDWPMERIKEDYLWDSKDSLGTNAGYF